MNEAPTFESSFDRLQEAHWHVHQMEIYYHHADPFRFSLSSFLRALKEIPDIIAMEAQGHEISREAWRTARKHLGADPLFKRLAKWRDVIVHQQMIAPLSTATVGSGDLRGMKVGLGRRIDPRLDSDFEMATLVKSIDPQFDPLHILVEDEDYLPCVQREWRLTDFPDQNILMLASSAWTLVASAFGGIERLLERTVPDSLVLDCVHKPRPRLYPRPLLIEARKMMEQGEDIGAVVRFLRTELGP